MRLAALTVVVVLNAVPAAAQVEIRFLHDPRPDAGIPREARFAGTRPDPDSKTESSSNVTFRLVTDLKDYGSLRNIIGRDIHAITIRYYDNSFKDRQDVQNYLTSVLRSARGHTSAYVPWAEGLPVPSVEATIQFADGGSGKWLLWPPNRSAYRDPGMKWWFTYGWQE